MPSKEKKEKKNCEKRFLENCLRQVQEQTIYNIHSAINFRRAKNKNTQTI